MKGQEPQFLTHPVKYDFWIQNSLTDHVTHVGSKCIKQFMSANEDLVAEVTEAEHLHGTKPCLHCKKPTKNENQLHKRCSKPFNEQLEKLQEKQRQKEQYLKLISLINMTKLNPVEDRFMNQ
jgi:hypothetical protein